MSSYTLAPAARQDLIDIRAYIAQDSPAAARRVIVEIRDAIRLVAMQPGIGHRREDLTTAPVRFKRAGSYQVVYKPDVTPLEVVRVLHVRRDFGPLLGDAP